MKTLIYILTVATLYSANTYGACTSPAGNVGVLKYNSGTMQFCDDTSWVDACPTGGCSAGAACTTAGQMQYFSGANMMRWCNGTNWYDTGNTTSGTCSKAGIMDYDVGAGAVRFCDGTNYNYMGNSFSAGGNYFVLTDGRSNGNFGSSGGYVDLDAYCVTDLTANNWNGKSNITVNATTTRAWMCLSATDCQELSGNKTYTFARSNEVGTGGATFTTNARGQGPGNSTGWSGLTYFNASVAADRAWTGRGAGTSTLWPISTGSSDNCSGWTGGTSGTQGAQGQFDFSTNAGRWSGGNPNCDVTRRLICMVDDPGSGSGSIVATQTGSTSIDDSTITFSSQSLGTASSDRVIVAVVTYEDEADLAISSITLGGTQMNLAVSSLATNGDDNEVFIYYLSSSSGTSADVVITLTGGTANGVGLDLYSLKGLASSFPQHTVTDTDTSSGTTVNGTIDLKANGVAVCGVTHQNDTHTISWTNATEQSDFNTGTGHGRHSSALVTSTTDSSVSVTATTSGSDTRRALACASWR